MDSMRTLRAFLRVLYTVNNNPQYILTKSSSQVPVITCTETKAQTDNEAIYARTSLKTCLTAVCDSSPELLQDPARDFSLYVLDPLEAHPLPTSLTHASQDTTSPRGVAVALGLMSWALESNDSKDVFVTGTLITHASPALEVIFALRETKRMPKPVFQSYPSLGLTLAPGSSQSPIPPQTAGMNQLSTSQEQRTLTRSADFPELYIGPPRRARGRPEGSTSSKSRISAQAGTSSLRGATSETPSDSTQVVQRRSKRKTKSRPPRPPPSHSPFICAPLARHTAAVAPESGTTEIPAVYQQFHSFNQNQAQSYAHLYAHAHPYFHLTPNPLLGLLSAIPSNSVRTTATNSPPEQQAALLSALQGLLTTNPQLLHLAATNMALFATSGEQTIEKKPMKAENAGDERDDHDGDSDIVILDSSTVDTTAFSKPSTWQLASGDHDTPPLATNQEPPTPSSQGTDSSPVRASAPSSAQESAQESSWTSTPSVALESPASTVTPEAETLTSKKAAEGGSLIASNTLNMPETPTLSRTRKRKLGEYTQDEVRPSTPVSSPSPPPSPSVVRASGSGRGSTVISRIRSSPISGAKGALLPLGRLPSMLGSMRNMATSDSRLQANSLDSLIHGRPTCLTINKSGNQSASPVAGPSKSKTNHSEDMDVLLNTTSDATSLKRRRTLNEFMAEHEARKNAKARKRPPLGRKLGADVPTNASQIAPSQSANLVSTTRQAQSSPPRPLFRSDLVASSMPASTYQPAVARGATAMNPAVPSINTLAPTAPSGAPSTSHLGENPFKKFVLPAWARTGTAMLPRLSEEALARQRAEREAKRAEISLKRREAAKAKRRRLHGVERHCKESSDEDDEDVTNNTKLGTPHPSSSVTPSIPLAPPPLPSLPVFASDAVGPIPSSPPRPDRQLPVVPSTPPRKPTSGSASHCTPSKPASCSLFTPSGQDPGSLFTPSTPSVTRSLTQTIFTPRSPTALHHSTSRKSPRKSLQTPRTPKRKSGHHQTPKNLRSGRNPSFVSPSLAVRTPQTGVGTRPFLLPPPSPCALRTPSLQKQVRSRMLGASTPSNFKTPGTVKQDSPLDRQNVEPDEDHKEKDALDGGPGDGKPTPPTQWSLSHPIVDDVQGVNGPRNITHNDGAPQAEEEYGSSPLPPSSPPPGSVFSSPAKYHDSDFHANSLIVPDSDTLLPSASGSDGPEDAIDTSWPLDGPCPASWLTESETSAWLTETEAWLTEAEGGPLLTDSDAAWLSDSDAVFGDVSSLPPSSTSNWLSDDAGVDTDGEFEAIGGREGGFDVAAFERAFAALVEHEVRSTDTSKDGTMHGTGAVEPEFWESMQPLLGGDAKNNVSTALDDAGSSLDKNMTQDIQKLLNDIVGT